MLILMLTSIAGNNAAIASGATHYSHYIRLPTRAQVANGQATQPNGISN